MKTICAMVLPVLVAGLGCDSNGGGNSAPVPAVTVAAPVITAPDFIAAAGTARVSTQPQAGCTYAWSVSGDPGVRIGYGQGTSNVAISGFHSDKPVKVTVNVQARTGSSSASGSATINILAPTEGQK